MCLTRVLIAKDNFSKDFCVDVIVSQILEIPHGNDTNVDTLFIARKSAISSVTSAAFVLIETCVHLDFFRVATIFLIYLKRKRGSPPVIVK